LHRRLLEFCDARDRAEPDDEAASGGEFAAVDPRGYVAEHRLPDLRVTHPHRHLQKPEREDDEAERADDSPLVPARN
jgi:hypothetical protein